jgi:signal peptidase I
VTGDEPAPKKSRLRRLTGSIWFGPLVAIIVIALVQSFLVKPYYVPSGSMEQTLEIGDRILVDRVYAGEPETRDVVVFVASDLWGAADAPPSNPFSYAVKWLGGVIGIGPSLDHVLVKRIIAGPGQTVSCCDPEGRVLVDGVPLDESYVFEDIPFASCETSARCFGGVTVPDGQYFVLGDHRSNSNDSIAQCRGRLDPISADDACLKMVGADDIVGRAFQVVWPLGRWAGL